MSPFQEAGHESIDEQAAHWFSRNRNERDPSSREQFNRPMPNSNPCGLIWANLNG